MMKLYDYLPSGNSYKARLLLSYLGQPYQHIPIDIIKGESQSADFKAKNPAGQIPLLQLEDGRLLPESNAILYYLAKDTELFPDNDFMQAQVLRWMFFEQYKHEPNIAVARFIHHYALESRSDELPRLMERGYGALDIMQSHLTDHNWFGADRRSIADIALYAYTHVAEEGGFDLSVYPKIKSWLARFKDHPRHILITAKPAS